MPRVDGAQGFGRLREFHYDDEARTKADRRDATLSTAKGAVAGWSERYAPFRNAAFRIEDVPNDAQCKREVVFGTPYNG